MSPEPEPLPGESESTEPEPLPSDSESAEPEALPSELEAPAPGTTGPVLTRENTAERCNPEAAAGEEQWCLPEPPAGADVVRLFWCDEEPHASADIEVYVDSDTALKYRTRPLTLTAGTRFERYSTCYGVNGVEVVTRIGRIEATEGEDLLFPLLLDGVNSRNVHVRYEARRTPDADAPAEPGADFDDDGVWVTIPAGTRCDDVPAGEHCAAIPVAAVDDLVNEGTETFEVVLTSAGDATLGAGIVGVGTIRDVFCVEVDSAGHEPPTLVVPDEVRVVEDAGPSFAQRTSGRYFTVGFDPPFCKGSAARLIYFTEDGTADGIDTSVGSATPGVLPDDIVDESGTSFTSGDCHRLTDRFFPHRSFGLSDGGRTARPQVPPVVVAWDRLDEPDETFTSVVEWHEDMPPAYSGQSRVPVVIVDDDPTPTVSVSGDGSVVEGQRLTFYVQLDAPTGHKPATVDWEVSGTATPGVDFSGDTEGTLEFEGGRGVRPSPTELTIGFDIETDPDSEGTETITVTPEGAVHLTLGTASATVQIHDGVTCVEPGNADHPPARLSVSGDVVAASEDVGTLNVAVTADPPLCSAQQGSIEYRTVDGSALARVTVGGGDFVGLGARDDAGDYAAGTFSRGEGTVGVRIVDDALDEDDEEFTLRVRWDRDTMPSHYHDQRDQVATIRISDDDPLPTLVLNDVDVWEGAVARFVVQLDAPSGREVRVDWTTADQPGANQATVGVDYGLGSGTLIFAPGETETLTVEARWFTANMPAAYHGLPTLRAGGEILDDDDSPTVSFVRPEGGFQAVEGDDVVFELELSEASPHPVTVYFVTRWTYSAPTGEHATSNVDFVARFGELVIPAGETSASITVRTIQDTLAENDEMFSLWLEPDPINAVLGESRARGTILNGDEFPRLLIDSPTAVEGEDLTFTITLSEPLPHLWATAWYVVGGSDDDGTADYKVDYQRSTGVLRFKPGETSRTVTITTYDDVHVEETETVRLHLSRPVRAVYDGSPGEGTITDNDEPPEGPLCAGQTEPPPLSIRATSWLELGGSANPWVTISLPRLCGDALVTIGIAGGTATEGVDFGTPEGWTGVVTIAAGSGGTMLSFWLANDGVGEGDETFTVTADWHSSMPDVFQDEPGASATIVIVDAPYN